MNNPRKKHMFITIIISSGLFFVLARNLGRSYYLTMPFLTKEHQGDAYKTMGNEPIKWNSSATPGEVFSNQTRGPIQPKKQQFCTRSQVQLGEWLPIKLPAPPYISVDTNQHVSKCYPTKDNFLWVNESSSSTSSWDTYTWVPKQECTMLDFSPQEMCRMMSGQTLLFIGDSKIQEVQHSLLYQLQPAAPTLSAAEFIKSRKKVQSHRVCNGTIVKSSQTQLQNVPSMLDRFKPTILVLNCGAHFMETSDLEKHIVQLVVVLETYVASHPGTRIFWKTTETGQPGCAQLPPEPIQNISAVLELVKLNATPAFHWNEFASQNELVLDIFASAKNNLTVQILDAFDLLTRRPDHHLKLLQYRSQGPLAEDCLHYCHPGPHDELVRLLFHFLKSDGL